MGKGSHNTHIDGAVPEQINSIQSYRLPTLSEIKIKLPAHCFRSTVRQSMSYVIKDIIYVTIAFLVMYQIQQQFQYGFLFFPFYWFFQGTFYTGFFILGHDCGHGSFSVYPLLNDSIGTLLHTWILTPYYSWKITHNKHHKNTGNIDKDEVFYPQRDTVYEPSLYTEILLWFPGIAWFYYLFNGYAPRTINHFNPFESLFYNRHFIGVCSSLIICFGMYYLMYLYICLFGFISLLIYHLIPVFIFACYIVIITLLHHTEIDVPWYADSEWNNVKGQLSTVDRNYGFVHSMIHSIGTHQIHHLFTKVPHYHLEEATMHFRQAYPELVRFNSESIIFAYARMFKIFHRQRSIGSSNAPIVMADSPLDESPTDDVQIKKSKRNSTKILLYMAAALSAWGDRMWQFAVGIYFISLNPNNLQGVALNGIALNLVVILLGTAVGDWIDRTARLRALRIALFVQNSSVALMAILVVIALYNTSILPTYWIIIIQGFLIAIGMIATLASLATKVSISKDWVVALYGNDRQNLANINATLRRIDLITNVCAPILTGAIMAFTSRWISAVVLAAWNIVSLVIELILYSQVYKSAKEILENKASNRKTDELSKKSKPGALRKLLSSIQGFGTYKSLSVFLPGLSLALLYMTVLSFDSVTRAYVIEQGLSEALLGIWNGLGSVLGIIGTLLYPIFVKRTGLVRTGVIGFWTEFAMLMLCLLSIFIHDSSIISLESFIPGLCRTNKTTNSTRTVDSVPFYCSTLKISVILLVSGIALNRFGLWIADLTVNQLQQERVPEDIRGRIGGTQHALNQFFDMLRYILVIILPRMSQFNYHIIISIVFVFTASLIYTIWSCSSTSELVPPAADIEMSEVNADSLVHQQTMIEEKANNDNNNV